MAFVSSKFWRTFGRIWTASRTVFVTKYRRHSKFIRKPKTFFLIFSWKFQFKRLFNSLSLYLFEPSSYIFVSIFQFFCLFVKKCDEPEPFTQTEAEKNVDSCMSVLGNEKERERKRERERVKWVFWWIENTEWERERVGWLGLHVNQDLIVVRCLSSNLSLSLTLALNPPGVNVRRQKWISPFLLFQCYFPYVEFFKRASERASIVVVVFFLSFERPTPHLLST